MESAGKLALVFPGQGCQFVGMGADLYESFPEAREVYDQADEILGFSLTQLCFTGPAEALNDTANTQPAIYTTTMALWRALAPRLEELRPQIAFAAGHSLGEFVALTVAGALRFEDGLRVVRARGEAMRDAVANSPGGMAAIIGLSDEQVAEVIAEAGGAEAGIWAANYNSPGQVVIAGRKEALERALAIAKEHKAKRAIPLAVSVPCHTPLMATAAERLAQVLEQVPWQQPWVPVVCNAEAAPLREPAAIKQALLRQLTSPVRWVESVQAMVQGGVGKVLEVGPKAVVSGLIRRIDRGLRLYSVTDAAGVEALDAKELAE